MPKESPRCAYSLLFLVSPSIFLVVGGRAFELAFIVYCVLQEKVLEIEYIKAVAPRKQQDPRLHDDWVSSVDGSNPRCISFIYIS